MAMGWGVAQVAPGRDRGAYEALEDAGLELFYPTVVEKRRIKYRGQTHITAPLIPGYIFVRFDRSDTAWRKTVGQKGVERYLGSTPEMPHQIPDTIIQDFRTRLAAGEFGEAPAPVLKRGDLVQLEAGPFAGQWGTVERIKKQIAEITAKVFGREIPVFMPVDQVSRVAA